MAVLPVTDPHILALICDACHRGLGGITAYLAAWPIMWRVARHRGWSGAADSTGPHRCAACSRKGAPLPSDHVRLLAHLGSVRTAAVVRLTGDLDAAVADELEPVLSHAMADHSHLALDLQGVHVIDSTALAVLVRAHQRLKPSGGKVCLAAPSRFVRVVLHTMHLETVFPMFDSADAALDRLAGPIG